MLGKLWNLPNTVLGMLVGGAGWLFGGTVGWGHNAIEFRDSPLMNGFDRGGALTLGNVIVYGSRAYGCADHEHIHTLQGQWLGPAYLPLNLLGMGLSLLAHPLPRLRRPRCGPFHGRLNFMEGWPRHDTLYGEPRRCAPTDPPAVRGNRGR